MTVEKLFSKDISITIMSMLRISFIGVLLMLGVLPKVKGQACCSGGSPISGVLGVTASGEQAVQLMVTYDQHYMNRLYNGSDLLEVDDRRRRIHNLMVEGSYGITDRLSVSGMFTFVRQSRTIKTFNTENTTTLNGVGDAFMLLKYQIINKGGSHPTQVILGTGPKFPLGRNDVEGENGVLLAPDLQPGTGSWDILTWGYVGRQNVLNTGLGLNSYWNYRITTPTDRANSNLDYQYGNEFQVNVGLNKALAVGQTILSPSLFGVYRNLAADQVDNEELANTGGQWLYLKPGVNWDIALSSSLRVAFDIPVYQDLNGTQLGSTYQLQIAYNHKF